MYYIISLINLPKFYYKSEIKGQMFQLCKARPDLSGALFCGWKSEGKKSGNGGRIKALKKL